MPMNINQIVDNYLTKEGKSATSLEEKRKLFLTDFLGKDKVNTMNPSKYEKSLEDLIKFKYFEAQHEGIYINENIMGLLKYLISVKLGKTKCETDQIILKQPSGLGIKQQITNFRYINYELYRSKGNPTEHFKKLYKNSEYEEYEDIWRNKKILEDMYQNALGKTVEYSGNPNNSTITSVEGYSSQKIFKYDDPFMGSIIGFYMQPREINNTPVSKISDVKIFYLFSNMLMDLKCGPQYDLLANTINLICAVRNTKSESSVCKDTAGTCKKV
jgi:hypothetical protein